MVFSCQPITGRDCLLIVLFGCIIGGVVSIECDTSLFKVENGIVSPEVNSFLAAYNSDLSETASKGAVLYTLSWDDDFSVSVTGIELQLQYSSANEASSSHSMVVKVPAEGIAGVADYPDPKVKDLATCTFRDSQNKECIIKLVTTFLDENTKHPEFDQSSYDVTLREDYPTALPIPTLEINVKDLDGIAPNNEFDVSFVGSCPLEVASLSALGDVTAQLKDPLDYDTMASPTIECTLEAVDRGEGHLTSTVKVTLTVEETNDEPPVFDFPAYYAIVQYTTTAESADPLDIQPAAIHASDKDKPPSRLSYEMDDAIEGVKGTNYFRIDSDSGEVFLQKNLSTEALMYGFFIFIVKATEVTGSLSTPCTLHLTLPPTTPTQTTTVSTTEGTCPPCEYTTPMECPSTVAPATCPPCESSTWSCPSMECPSTSEPTTCPPCESSTWSCPTLDCPSTVESTTCPPCTTGTPSTPSLEFVEETFFFMTYYFATPGTTVGIVYATASEGLHVFYNWADDSENKDLFSIFQTTGEVTVKSPNLEISTYRMRVRAVADTLEDFAEVIIEVKELKCDIPVLSSALWQAEVDEGESAKEILTLSSSSKTASFCIAGVTPPHMQEKFTLSSKGALETKEPLDRDWAGSEDAVVKIKVQVDEISSRNQCSATANIEENLSRNQAWVYVTINDINDSSPTFDFEEVHVAYPVVPSLQNAVGPLITLKASDKDQEGNLEYHLKETDLPFVIDYKTGSIYGQGEFECKDTCDLVATVFDGKNEDSVRIEVLPLDMDHIYTLALEDVTVSDVEATLEELSDSTSLKIFPLYMSPSIGSSERRVRRGTTNLKTNLEVNVYALNEKNELVSLKSFNEKLTDTDSEAATEFKDKSFFETTGGTNGADGDAEGLTIAVAILGSLLGVVLVAWFVMAILYRKRSSRKPKKAPSDGQIPTLGSIYSNEAFELDDNTDSKGKPTTRQNGSVKEYKRDLESGIVVSSIPIYELPPETPAYSSEPTNIPSAPPRGQMPPKLRSGSPLPSKGTKSILKNKEEKGTREGLVKPAEPATDYDDEAPAGSFFGKLKTSPPMHRSLNTSPPADEDAQENLVAVTPLGTPVPEKKSNLKGSNTVSSIGTGDGGAEDKSVAFKILVESVEIEAENPSPFIQEQDNNTAAVDHLEKNAAKIKAEEEEEVKL